MTPPLFDVRVTTADGRAGDMVRVLAGDADAAEGEALARFPAGWVADVVVEAEGDSDGIDLTAPGAPDGPLLEALDPPPAPELEEDDDGANYPPPPPPPAA